MSQLFQNLLWKPEFPPTPVLEEDFNAFNITRFEDTFNRTDPAPWLPESNATLSIVSQSLNILNSGAERGRAYLDLTPYTTQDKWYRFTGQYVDSDSGFQARVDASQTTTGNELYSENLIEGSSFDFTIQAPVGAFNLIFLGASGTDDNTKFDNVLIEEVPALDGLTAVNVTPSVTDGVLRLENTTAAAGYAYYTAPTTASSVYDFEWTDPESDPDSAVSIGTTAGGIDLQTITATKQFQFTATTATSFVNLWVNSAVLGEDAYFGSFSVTEDTGVTESGVIGFGGVKFKDNSVGTPQFVDRGLPFDDTFILAVDSVNAVDYVYQGLPFTVLGRIAVDLVGPVDRVAPGNIPLSAAGRLVFSAGPVAVAVAGVNYAADESVVGIPS